MPGFGTLIRSYVPAKFDQRANVFHPPTYLFELDRSAQYDDPYLSKEVARHQNLDLPKATAKVNEYGERLKRDLIANGKTEIQEVVMAYQEGRQVKLLPHASVSFEEYPSVDLSNLWESDYSKVGMWWEFSAFISMMLVILAGVFYLVNSSKSGSNYPYESNYPPLIGEYQDTLQGGLEADALISVDEVNDDKRRQDDTDPVIRKNSPIIIVGAFAREYNVRNMKTRLSEKGWNIYQDSIRRNLVRVGMVPEEHEDIDQVLGIVRKEIDPEAWVLVK